MGPCLCGDLACPRCGNPEALERAELAEAASERLAKLCQTKEEFEFAMKLIETLILEVRRAAKQRSDEMIALNSQAAESQQNGGW